MQNSAPFEIFLMCPPGLEEALCEEVQGKGFKKPRKVAGGAIIKGGWPDVWRANLWLRGATRVLARIASFRALHFSQLEAHAAAIPWRELLRADVPFRVEASCKKSRLYHSGAIEERLAHSLTKALGARFEPENEASLLIKARLENDLCTLSLDTSGEPLHKRGFKQAVNLAPMRETMAALFLMQCGYKGDEPVLDPMCGSGTFVIEAAEIAARLNPGRARSFAFEKLATFDPEAWQRLRAAKTRAAPPAFLCHGSDRDAGAILMSAENAQRAGVADLTRFEQKTISDLTPPEGRAGLVIVNPPYGARLGETQKLGPLYRALGQTLKSRFTGWRVGLIASEASLARATALPFLPAAAPVQHGGLRVTLYKTDPL